VEHIYRSGNQHLNRGHVGEKGGKEQQRKEQGGKQRTRWYLSKDTWDGDERERWAAIELVTNVSGGPLLSSRPSATAAGMMTNPASTAANVSPTPIVIALRGILTVSGR
jgi:hypothetical protein